MLTFRTDSPPALKRARTSLLVGEDTSNKENDRTIANLLAVGFRLKDATLFDHLKKPDYDTMTGNSVAMYNTIMGQVKVFLKRWKPANQIRKNNNEGVSKKAVPLSNAAGFDGQHTYDDLTITNTDDLCHIELYNLRIQRVFYLFI